MGLRNWPLPAIILDCVASGGLSVTLAMKIDGVSAGWEGVRIHHLLSTSAVTTNYWTYDGFAEYDGCSVLGEEVQIIDNADFIGAD